MNLVKFGVTFGSKLFGQKISWGVSQNSSRLGKTKQLPRFHQLSCSSDYKLRWNIAEKFRSTICVVSGELNIGLPWWLMCCFVRGNFVDKSFVFNALWSLPFSIAGSIAPVDLISTWMNQLRPSGESLWCVSSMQAVMVWNFPAVWRIRIIPQIFTAYPLMQQPGKPHIIILSHGLCHNGMTSKKFKKIEKST